MKEAETHSNFTIPILHSSNSNSSNPILFQSYTLLILHSSNPKTFKRVQLLHVTCIFDYIINNVTLGRAWAQKVEPDIKNLKHILKFKKGKHMIKYLFLI